MAAALGDVNTKKHVKHLLETTKSQKRYHASCIAKALVQNPTMGYRRMRGFTCTSGFFLVVSL